jgi:hypothetical protein
VIIYHDTVNLTLTVNLPTAVKRHFNEAMCVVKLISSTESEWFVVLFAVTERAKVAAICPTVH